MYCSELIWKIYKNGLGIEIGRLEKLGDFDLSHELVHQTIYERFGENIPIDETVISPANIFNSENLYTVFEK